MPYPIPEREIDKLWYYLVYAPSVARFYGWLNDKFSNNITYMGQNNLLEGKAFSFTNSEIISKWHQITFYRDVPAAIPRMVTRRGRTINVNTYRADDNIHTSANQFLFNKYYSSGGDTIIQDEKKDNNPFTIVPPHGVDPFQGISEENIMFFYEEVLHEIDLFVSGAKRIIPLPEVEYKRIFPDEPYQYSDESIF